MIVPNADNKIRVEHVQGNLYDAATFVNKMGWADYVVSMEYSHQSTGIVMRMPTAVVHDLRRASRSYVSDVNHDTYQPK